MDWLNFRRDGFMLIVFALLVVLLGAGLIGADRVFAYGFVGLLGLFFGLGFVRRSRPVTWVPPTSLEVEQARAREIESQRDCYEHARQFRYVTPYASIDEEKITGVIDVADITDGELFFTEMCSCGFFIVVQIADI